MARYLSRRAHAPAVRAAVRLRESALRPARYRMRTAVAECRLQRRSSALRMAGAGLGRDGALNPQRSSGESLWTGSRTESASSRGPTARGRFTSACDPAARSTATWPRSGA